MSTDTSKIRSKLAKLDKSLDQLESHLGPLLAQSLPETLLALDTVQQAKLQVIIPYVVYDLIFVYLKSRGIDPKTHPVVAELERVRQYFEKISHAEDLDRKRKLGVDKAAAGRFIKHAIAQAKNAHLVDEASDGATAASTSASHERVPVKVTSKMTARAEYEKELKELRSEEEEDLEVFDEEVVVEDEEAIETADSPPEDTKSMGLDKGKGRASEGEQFKSEQVRSSGRKRPRIDPFSGYDGLSVSESIPQITDHNEKAKLSTPVQTSEGEAGKVAKKAKRKAKKSRNL